MATTSLFFDIFARDMNAKETFAGIEAAGLGMGKGLSSMLAPLGLAFAGLGIADVVGHMVKAAGDFEAANTRLVTSAGESAANLKMVGDGILQVAQDTGTTVENLQKGAYYIESAGYHGADMLNILKAAAQGAKAEGADVSTVGDAVTSALRDYNLKASDAADVTSKMVTAVGDGKTTFELFTGSLHSVLPVAAQAHISMNDILGDLASMTVHGMSADQASQDLNHTIMKLINPTQQQTNEFALFGTSAQEVQGKLGSDGLSGALNFLHDKIVSAMPPGSDKVLLDMKTALQGLSPEVQKLGTQMADGTLSYKDFLKQAKDMSPVAYEQAKSLVGLLGTTHKLGTEQLSGKDVLQNYAQAWRLLTGDQTGASTAMMLTGENANYTQKAVGDVASASKDAAGNVKGWSDIQNTFNNKLDRFKETIGAMAIKIGTELLPKIGDALDSLGKFASVAGPGIADAYNKYFKPVLDEFGGLLLKVFGGGSGEGDGSDVGNAADGWNNAMEKVGTNANGTLGVDGSATKAAHDFVNGLDEVGKAFDNFYKGMATINLFALYFQNIMDGVEANMIIVAGSIVMDWNSHMDQLVIRVITLGNQIYGAIQSAFWGANQWLFQAGADIITGLGAGILNSLGSLGNVLGTVTSYIASHKGPPEYDRVMLKPHGQWIMQGLMDGITGSIPDLGRTLGKVTTTIATHDMTPSWGNSSPYAAGGAQRLRLVVDGHEFNAYVDGRAGNAIDAADWRAGRRPSR